MWSELLACCTTLETSRCLRSLWCEAAYCTLKGPWHGEVYQPSDMERLTVPWRPPDMEKFTRPLIRSGLYCTLKGPLAWRSLRALWCVAAYCTLKGSPNVKKLLTVPLRFHATWRSLRGPQHGEVYELTDVEWHTIPWRAPDMEKFTRSLIFSGLLYLEGSRDVE